MLVRILQDYRKSEKIDFVIGNVENVTEGSGVSQPAFKSLRGAGIDVCTTGDHVYRRADILKLFDRYGDLIIRPLNYPKEAAGEGWTQIETPFGLIAVVNLQGRVFMDPSDDPFAAMDVVLPKISAKTIIVDFHAEATSEKRAMAWHLDGRVTALFGTHTHVPTADEEILPQGTAYISDIGMCGAYRSVIGRNAHNVLKVFRTKMYAPFTVARDDVRVCGIVLDIDESTGRARSIDRIALRADDGA